MLNSAKKNSLSATKKKKYSNSRVVRKKISERNKKKHNTPLPPFKLNGRSLTLPRTEKLFYFKITSS